MNDNSFYNYDPADTNGDTKGFVAADSERTVMGQQQQAPQYPQNQGQGRVQQSYPDPSFAYNNRQNLHYYSPTPNPGNPGPGNPGYTNPGNPGYTNPPPGAHNGPPYPMPQYPYPDPGKAPYPFVPPTPIRYTTEPPIQPNTTKQLSAGTFLIPLGFMALHMLVLTIITSIFSAIRMFSNITDINVDPEVLQESFMKDLGAVQVYSLLIAAPILIGIYLLAAYLLRKRGNPYVYLNKPPLGHSLRAIVIGIGCIGIANLIMILFQELAKVSDFVSRQYETYITQTGSLTINVPLALLFLAVVVLVPIAEELLFRGIIAGEFRRAMPDWLNILINGVLFALFHMNFIQSTYVLPAGLMLAAVGLWSRSIWVPIILHAVYNFCGSVLLVIIGDNETVAGIYFIVQLACILIGAVLAVISYRRRKKEVLMVYP